MLKQILSLLILAAGTTLPTARLNAQNVQSTIITKQSFDNPTIAVASFNGLPEHQAKLQDLLIRCGWFRVLPSSAADKAQIKVDATMSGNILSGNLSYNGKTAPIGAQTSDANLTLLTATDDILAKLFNIPPICSRKIVFVRHNANLTKELYACYLDGTGQERITFNNAISTEPGWGHANALVYTAIQNNSLAIVLMNFKDKQQRIVSRAKGLNASAALSPDGRTVALALSEGNTVDLYTIDLETKAKKRLTRDNAVESSPCWSPDGKQICFVSDALAIGAPRLFIVPANGSKLPKMLQTGRGEAVSPDWSRFNNRLCYATKTSYGKYAIATLDMSNPSARPEIVTAADGDWEAPSWAPDGRQIICTRAVKNARDIIVVDTFKGVFHPITRGAVLSLPTWQPSR